MVKLIIRDDDCNFFTRPEDIENVYKRIPDFPVSFAVVPIVTDVIGGCPDTKDNTIPRYIGENMEIVSYLRDRLKKSNCDILLHGITHGYKYSIENVKIPEMVWRNNQPNLSEEIAYWKKDFENLFGCSIKCFVAPSNTIGKDALKAVYSNGLNFSGIISVKFERYFSLLTLWNYIRRIYVRAIRNYAHPGLLDYGTHKELNANNHLEYDYLVNLFHYCEKYDYPLAINVHYWHMRDYPEKYDGFFKFIDYALEHGAVPTKLSDIF